MKRRWSGWLFRFGSWRSRCCGGDWRRQGKRGRGERGGGRDGAGRRRRRRSRSGGGEYEEAEEVEKAEERDASAVNRIPLSLHEDAKREREDWIPAGAEAGAGAGKATVVQRLYMLLEQTTDSRDREESEWPVTSRGGTVTRQPGAGTVPLPNGKTEMK